MSSVGREIWLLSCKGRKLDIFWDNPELWHSLRCVCAVFAKVIEGELKGEINRTIELASQIFMNYDKLTNKQLKGMHTDIKLENNSPLISPGQPVLVVGRTLVCQKAFLYGCQIYFLGAPTVASVRVFQCTCRAAHSTICPRDSHVAEDLLCHVVPAEVLVHHFPAGTERPFARACLKLY